MLRYELIKGYPGSNAARFNIREEDSRLFIGYPEEKCYAAGVWHDYAWSFNFGLQNISGERLEIDVFVNCLSAQECPAEAFTLYCSRNPVKGFERNGDRGRSDGYTRYHFVASIPPGETVYFSNTLPRDYESLLGSLERKAQIHGISPRAVGSTVEGREIRAFEFGDPHNGKPNLLYTSGFHPAEGDSYAVEAIFDYLCNDEGRRWLEDFNVILIPAVNPDGFVHGINGANLNGVNLYWNFEYEDREKAPEAYSLWKYFQEIKPTLYVDFHAYVTQINKRMGPYVKPVGLYATDRVREIDREMNAFLIEMSGGKYQRGYLTYAKTTLAYLLTKHFNTITYTKFHFHLKNGVPLLQKQAIRIFGGLADILRKHGVSSPADVLVRPASSVKRSLLESLCLWFLVTREEMKNPLRRIRAALR